jgi:hypothetical protein
LHDALSHSGLFYESHQAQWIAGTRPTTQLLLEPQNQLTPKQPPQNVLPQNTGIISPDMADKPASPLPLAQTASEARVIAPNIPEHLQTLVKQQLGALETHQVLWQGQVWQGQEMRWEVREESPHRNAQGMEEGQWITQIHLDLPNLGGVSAHLSFNGNALNRRLRIRCPDTTAGNATAIVAP